MSFALPRLASLRERERTVVAGAAIAVLAALLFGGAAWNGFTRWDDDLYVLRNPAIRDTSLAGIGRVFTTPAICNYHPLTILSFMAEHAAVGLEPWLYHLDNVLLHAAASVLAFLVARRWLGRDGAAFAAAILFLVHPLRVESVAWVAERKDVLCAAFYLASLLAYTAYLEGDDGRRRKSAYAAALALFLGALLSKVMAVTLPGVIAMYVTARGSWSRRTAASLAPFVALSIAFAWIGVAAQSADGAVEGLHGGGLVLHALTMPRALAFYAAKLVWPIDLSPRYVFQPAAELLDPWVLAGVALAAAGLAAAFVSFRRNRRVFLGIGLFAISWAPVSGVVPLSTIVADRYVYLPSFGLFIAAASWLDAELPRILHLSVRATLVACVLGFAGLTIARIPIWREGETLWSDALRENPENPFAHNQLTLAHLEAGRYPDAAASARAATRLGLRRPEHVFNLCLASRGLGDRQGELETARGILESTPDFLPASIVVSRQLVEDGRIDECASLIERLDREHPDDPGLHAARARLEEARGHVDAALLAYLRSIELRPGDPETLLGAAAMLARLGDLERAVTTAENAVALPGGVLPPGARARVHEISAVAAERGSASLALRGRTLELRAARD